MMIPEFLTDNDSIGIVSTARFITKKELQPAIDFLNQLGLNVVTGKNLFNRNNQFAGNDQERLEDFQYMIDNPKIKAILCARGGYGTVRIIDHLDFTLFLGNPKWIIGYSDVTVIHNHINQLLQIPTIHASMPINFPTNTRNTMDAFGETIKGERKEYTVHANVKRIGKTKSEIIGGNLSIIYSLMGSKSQIKTDGKILFIEDIDEMLYHIDRMMIALDRANMLSNLTGLIVGGMTNMRDNTKVFGFSTDNGYGQTAEQIIWHYVKDFDYPICFAYPAGHQKKNLPLILGMECNVDFQKNSVHIDY